MRRIYLIVIAFMTMALNGMAFNVFMCGDSHVCSKIYPERVGDILVDADPEIIFSYWGKIGAGLYTYNDTPEYMHHIYNAKPDVLIVHLGTNDSYTPEFSKEKFTRDLEEFYNNVSHHLPNCMMVFVTPFYNKFKNGNINKETRECADAYKEFAADHKNAYVVDNNADYGMFFLDGGDELIRRDGVHLTVEGYEQLGDQVGQGLIDLEALWLLAEEPYFE